MSTATGNKPIPGSIFTCPVYLQLRKMKHYFYLQLLLNCNLISYRAYVKFCTGTLKNTALQNIFEKHKLNKLMLDQKPNQFTFLKTSVW